MAGGGGFDETAPVRARWQPSCAVAGRVGAHLTRRTHHDPLEKAGGRLLHAGVRSMAWAGVAAQIGLRPGGSAPARRLPAWAGAGADQHAGKFLFNQQLKRGSRAGTVASSRRAGGRSARVRVLRCARAARDLEHAAIRALAARCRARRSQVAVPHARPAHASRCRGGDGSAFSADLGDRRRDLRAHL